MEIRKWSLSLAKAAAALALIALVVTLCVPNAATSFRSAFKLSKVSSFKYEVAHYIGTAQQVDYPEVGPPTAIAGRLVPIDTSRRDIDEKLYYLLDRDLRAVGPDEVGSVALIHWSVDPHGGPGGAGLGIAEVRILDLRGREMIGRITVAGEDEEPPRKELAALLNSLVRRPASARAEAAAPEPPATTGSR